jgi:hypothetical protein
MTRGGTYRMAALLTSVLGFIIPVCLYAIAAWLWGDDLGWQEGGGFIVALVGMLLIAFCQLLAMVLLLYNLLKFGQFEPPEQLACISSAGFLILTSLILALFMYTIAKIFAKV